MRKSTDQLIEQLSSSATPVRAIRSPILRAAMISLPLLGLMSVIAIYAGNPLRVLSHMNEQPAYAIATLSSLATGLVALFVALSNSVPGRTQSWTWAVMVPMFTWLISSALLCANGMTGHEGPDISIFASAECFYFIMLSGTTIAIVFYAALRNTVPINSSRVSALSGLSAAMFGATLLAFFHPPESDLIDFGAHLAATTALILFMATSGRAAIISN